MDILARAEGVRDRERERERNKIKYIRKNLYCSCCNYIIRKYTVLLILKLVRLSGKIQENKQKSIAFTAGISNN